MAETLKKIKEIYGWDEEINDDTEFLEYVKYRESIYEKYYDSPNLKEDYEKLKEENKLILSELGKYDPWDDTPNIVSEFDKLKKDLDTNIEVRCNLETDNFKLASQIKKLTEEIDELTHDKQELEKIEEIWKEGDTEVKQLKEEIFEWRKMASREFGDVSVDPWYPGEVAIEIEDLKNQIPKKPRKCFSYNDKKVLESLLEDVECLSQAGFIHSVTGATMNISGFTGWGGFDAKKKLIERLLK